MDTPDILIKAIRQYQHNDCSGLLIGFDKSETISIVNNLLDRLNESVDRINDMLMGDDGQAWKEAEKFLDKLEKLNLLKNEV